MKKFVDEVKKFILRNRLIEKGDHVLIALSGGPDSIALLMVLHELKDELQINISAAHLNHSLRGKDADKDEQFSGKFCDNIGVQFFTKKENVRNYAKTNKLSLEEAGRELRYRFLKETSEKIGATKTATGHNADDNLETIIQNFVRGSGLRGIAGIPVKRDRIIRPLLSTSRKEILEYLENKKIKYRIDKTNQKEIYRRNVIRRKIVPELMKLNPNLFETTVRFSEIIRESLSALEKSSEKFQHLITKSGNSINLDISDNINYFEIIIMQLLSRNIEQTFGFIPTFNDIDSILSLIANEKGAVVQISNSLEAIRESKSILIRKKTEDAEFSSIVIPGSKIITDDFVFNTEFIDKNNIVLQTDKFVEFIDADKIKRKLQLRNWKSGDKIKPIGMKGIKKVSDLLTDAKIKHSTRKKILVLRDDEDIVWVCGVRLSDKFKISSETKNVLRLNIRYDFELQ